MKFIGMHADKLISTIAIVLNIAAWDKISLVAGAILAIIMIVYYTQGIYYRWKDRKDEDVGE
jgi:hypothetical protein